MKKKVLIIIGATIILMFFAYMINRISIENIKSNSTYIGKEYRYTVEGSKRAHENKREYCFYIRNENNAIFCVLNNRECRKINNIEDLERLYIRKINCLVIDENNAGATYDEKGKETSSAYLKNKMFPDVESDYLRFRE